MVGGAALAARRCWRGPRRPGCGWSTVPEALAEHEPVERAAAARSSWGEDKDFSTWDSPPVADLAWAARRLELRLLRALARRPARRRRAERAARELLAAQASDWAFLDQRGQAGDYACQRATDHAEALLEAIDSDRAPIRACVRSPRT